MTLNPGFPVLRKNSYNIGPKEGFYLSATSTKYPSDANEEALRREEGSYRSRELSTSERKMSSWRLSRPESRGKPLPSYRSYLRTLYSLFRYQAHPTTTLVLAKLRERKSFGRKIEIDTEREREDRDREREKERSRKRAARHKTMEGDDTSTPRVFDYSSILRVLATPRTKRILRA